MSFAPCATLPDELASAVLDRATYNQLLLPVHVLPGQPVTSTGQNQGHIKRLRQRDSPTMTAISRQVTCLVKTEHIQALFASERTLKPGRRRGVQQTLQHNFALSTNIVPETQKNSC